MAEVVQTTGEMDVEIATSTAGGGRGGAEMIDRTKPEYFLMPWREQRRLKRCRFTVPPTHSTNHRALVAQIYTGTKGSLKAYRWKL